MFCSPPPAARGEKKALGTPQTPAGGESPLHPQKNLYLKGPHFPLSDIAADRPLGAVTT